MLFEIKRDLPNEHGIKVEGLVFEGGDNLIMYMSHWEGAGEGWDGRCKENACPVAAAC